VLLLFGLASEQSDENFDRLISGQTKKAMERKAKKRTNTGSAEKEVAEE